jgi:hypothetical protein
MSTMVNPDGLKRGMQNYGPKQNAVMNPSCDRCGHGVNDHNAKGQGPGCDRCGCGVFHGVGYDASGRPDKQKK